MSDRSKENDPEDPGHGAIPVPTPDIAKTSEPPPEETPDEEEEHGDGVIDTPTPPAGREPG